MNQEQGKQFYLSHLGVVKNTGAGTDKLRAIYNGNLRTQPKSPEQTHLERQNKILRDALQKAQRK